MNWAEEQDWFGTEDIAPVADAAKTIIEISEINLMMLRNFYIPTFDTAHAVYTLYADQLYEFYNSNINN